MLQLIAGLRAQPGQKEKTLGLGHRHSASSTMAAPPQAIEDQGVLLENALGSVRMHTSQMRRCLDTPGKLMDALKCAYDFVIPIIET